MKNTGSHQFTYSGQLHENPLPEILFTIGQYKVPGVITFTHQQQVKQIFVRDGIINYAASNVQEDHLGEFLFRCGKITRRQFDQSVDMNRINPGSRLGDILIHMKAMPAADLNWAVRSQQQAIVWSLFNWFEGDMRFEIGSYKHEEPIQLDLAIPRAILDGVRNIQNAKKIITYIGSRNTVLELSENALLAIEAYGANEKERDILKRVNGKSTLYEICAETPYGPHETVKILYGMMTLKLIRAREGIRLSSSVPGGTF